MQPKPVEPPRVDLPWEPLLEAGSATDVISILLGVLVFVVSIAATVFIALRQFRLTHEQEKIIAQQTELIEEQNETAKRVERMTAEQGVFIQRQAEILETLHAVLEEQRQRAAAACSGP